MKNLTLIVICSIIGYNYDILKNCTEASAKIVKKYISAISIISIIWFLIGFLFCNKYLKKDTPFSTLAGFVMVFIIIMIERQIILTIGKHTFATFIRWLLGIVMAFIGSAILDQIIFQDDIEKIKTEQRSQKVNDLLPQKTIEFDLQISSLDSSIKSLEKERTDIIDELQKKPVIFLPSFQKTTDSLGRPISVSRGMTSQPNPKNSIISGIDTLLEKKRSERNKILIDKLNLRRDLEEELRQQKGFLDELKILKSVIFDDWVSIVFYSSLFLLLFFIELFVIIIKSSDIETDYDLTITHQMNCRKEQLRRISFVAEPINENKLSTS